MTCYNEFSGLDGLARELGITTTPFAPRRCAVEVHGRIISAVQWGAKPEIIFLHGGGQNAHTWDATVLAVARPALAIDLPGHGHSSWRGNGYDPGALADDVARALDALVSGPLPVTGMSLGGLVGIELAAAGRVTALALVDITPAVTQERAAPVLQTVMEAASKATEDDLLDFLSTAMPQRSRASLQRSLGHNIVRGKDGWRWRYDPDIMSAAAGFDASPLWQLLRQANCPTLLVRGGRSKAVLEADIDRLRSHLPRAEVAVIDGAGHSIQSDAPIELAAQLRSFLGLPSPTG